MWIKINGISERAVFRERETQTNRTAHDSTRTKDGLKLATCFNRRRGPAWLTGAVRFGSIRLDSARFETSSFQHYSISSLDDYFFSFFHISFLYLSIY
jgi:hypothetical protein